MKLKFPAICLLVLTLSPAVAQKGFVDVRKIPAPQHHYLEEYTFDSPTQPELWTKEKRGLNAAFVGTQDLFLRTEVPALKSYSQWESTSWRGERLQQQILVWSPDTLQQVRLRVSDLSNGQQIIPASQVRSQLVRYVLSNYSYGAKAMHCASGSADTAYLMPDRLESFDRFELPGRTVRSIWLSIDIPSNAVPGTYQGKIDVSTDAQTVSMDVRILVQGMTLPSPKDWAFRLDLWQNPWVVAGYFNVEPWSEEHKTLLRKHMKLYADVGGKYITTYAVHSPWSDNSYRIEGTMIDWIKQKDGNWKFNYDIFDQYVQLAMDAGVDEAITIYTPVPWGHRFRYMDEATGNYVYEAWSPDTEKFKTFWNIFLTDLKKHLQQKGWLEKTYLGINENPLDVTLAAAAVIRNHSKDWKITYAGNWHPELTDVLDDYSPVIESEPSQAELKRRKEKGLTTTYYVCCTPARPNNFVFSPPFESTYIGWYAAAYGYDGFLRWAYDAWPADPMRDARHTLWPAGDCFLVYPGGQSSIRMEKLREGIVDYEKLRILKELSSKSKNRLMQQEAARINAALKSFMVDRSYNNRSFDAAQMVASMALGKTIIHQWSEHAAKEVTK